jgi:hypothetical protein
MLGCQERAAAKRALLGNAGRRVNRHCLGGKGIRAFAGLSLGYGVGLSDAIATGNILTDCGYGIAASVAPGAGGATIRDNRIVRARQGAIVGMEWDRVAAPDLVAEAGKYPRLTIVGNDAR